MLGEGHHGIDIYCTFQIGHTIYEGHQRLQCWPFTDKKYYGFNLETFIFARPPGVEQFVLSPDDVCFKLLFTLYVHID